MVEVSALVRDRGGREGMGMESREGKQGWTVLTVSTVSAPTH